MQRCSSGFVRKEFLLGFKGLLDRHRQEGGWFGSHGGCHESKEFAVFNQVCNLEKIRLCLECRDLYNFFECWIQTDLMEHLLERAGYLQQNVST